PKLSAATIRSSLQNAVAGRAHSSGNGTKLDAGKSSAFRRQNGRIRRNFLLLRPRGPERQRSRAVWAAWRRKRRGWATCEILPTPRDGGRHAGRCALLDSFNRK